MKQLKASLKLTILLMAMVFMVVSCQKEDDYQNPIEEAQVEKTNAINLSAKDIPAHILDFVKTKTNNTFRVSIAKNNVKLSTSNVNDYSRETPLGIVQTSKVVQVYNERNIKYTFKVSDPINAGSVINLVVVDMDGDIIEYFIQYIFDPNVPIQYTSTGVVDMARFSGAIIFYDNEGNSIGNYILADGNLVSFEGASEPCNDYVVDDDDDEDDDTTNNGGSGSGGGTLPDDPNNNDDNGYNPGNGGNGEFANSDNPCGLQIFYGDCGCGPLGENDGHEKNPNSHCCNGSPTTLYNSCNGASYTWNRSATSVARAGGDNETSPCSGEVGVLIEIDVLIDDIEECLGMEIGDISYSQATEMYNYLITQNQCSEQAQEDILDILVSANNNSLVTAFPFVRYPDELAEEYTENYPNFTNFLKEEILEIKDDQEVVDALIQVGVLEEEEIIEALTWGKGPEIRITPLSSNNVMLGKYNPTPLGEDGASFGPNVIEINSYFVDLLEEDLSSDDPQYDIKALKFFIAIVILHEITHYADFHYEGNAFFENDVETGNLFEDNLFHDFTVYGEQVTLTIDNFTSIVQQYFLTKD